MPTYVYRREDGSTFEIEQRISEPALTEDPETGQKVVRVITGAGLVFRGSGFYLTDYARKSADKKAAESGKQPTEGASSSEKAAPAESAAPAPAPAAEPKASPTKAAD
jgi:predicted nucleic acid-binding Zn ribbon protein